ncbi:MAG: hypothetical protein JJW03_02530 [Desulfosarcina sp.]|nr:hypothetical protein [Desulfobacterales bacterium]
MKALEIFKAHLPNETVEDINMAWKEYCHHPDSPNTLWFEQYSWKIRGIGKDRESELKNLALERIEKIVNFAQ